MISSSQVQANKEKIKSIIGSIDRPGIDELLEYLESSDFFIAPASTKYHEPYDGGLAHHSLKVFEIADTLFMVVHGREEYEKAVDSIKLTAICHDMCKINIYKKGQLWRKDSKGKWESYTGYIFADENPLATHGPKSTILLSRFVKLKDEEAMAISWHSGSFGLGTNDMNSLMKANEKHPLVLMIHMADMLSACDFEDDKIEKFVLRNQAV